MEPGDALEELRQKCVTALRSFLEESQEMCRLLGAIKEFPVGPDEQAAIEWHRAKEVAAYTHYMRARDELFIAAKWGREALRP